MPDFTHSCFFCPTQGGAKDRSTLPDANWRWMTRRQEGLDAVAVCPTCVPKHMPRRLLGRVGGQHGRAARGGNR